MMFDKIGFKPSDYVDMHPDARCPECDSKLYKRGGGSAKCIEHWAHYPDPNRDCFVENYGGEESQWHLDMKTAFRDAGCEVEKTIMANGNRYRIDAFKDGVCFEFVNSISRSYIKKTKDLLADKLKPVWVINGQVFAEETKQGYELPGRQMRFSKWCEAMEVDCYVMVFGLLVGAVKGKVIKHRGISNAGRFVKFMTTGYTGWPWSNFDDYRDDKTFFNNQAYINAPLCKSREDFCNVIGF
jgi:hypothetical protein